MRIITDIKERSLLPLMAGKHTRHHAGLMIRAWLIGWVLIPLISTIAAPSLPRSGAHASIEDPSFDEPNGGIREAIPEKYWKRYQEWKKEFLSTETGKSQWEKYAQNTRFLLTITVSQDDQNGAATGKYVWDHSGVLVTAEITLGCRIDQGYPRYQDYPVLNSLTLFAARYVENSRNILAAAKIAHEFGHVNNTARSDGALFQLQNQLISAYISILLSNGYDTRDPLLIELGHQMGGTAVEICENRESSGEANALLYLRDKIAEKRLPCSIFTRIKENVELLAKSHAQRFVQITGSKSTVDPCASQRLPRLVAKQ